jgi:hypothetical protein
MKIHAAVVPVLPGIESHSRPPFHRMSVPASTFWDGNSPSPPETGASISITAFERTAASALRLLAVPSSLRSSAAAQRER